MIPNTIVMSRPLPTVDSDSEPTGFVAASNEAGLAELHHVYEWEQLSDEEKAECESHWDAQAELGW